MAAEFIPETFKPETPFSERSVAQLIKHDPAASGLTVYHSYGLGAHENRPHGEIDFVVLIPPDGMVIVEVKGDRISRREGEWYQAGNGYNKRINDPTDQLRRNQYEFARKICEQLPGEYGSALRYAGLLVLSGSAATPDMQDLECNPWEIVSQAEIKRHGIAACFTWSLKQTREAITGRRNPLPAPQGLMKHVKSTLRRDFDLPVSSIAMRTEEERRRITLTNQQYRFLDVVKANGRAFVTGGAGTGKTLLALEHARRECMKGRKVGLFCFNRLLGDWLKKETAARVSELSDPICIEIEAGTFQSWMTKLVNENPETRTLFDGEIGRVNGSDRWQVLDDCAALALENREPPFDTIIVDEIQDFQRPGWSAVLDRSVRGGFRTGHWVLFGDFCRQSLFGVSENLRSEEDFLEGLSGFGAYPVRIPLHANCRNTKRIANMTVALTGFDAETYEVLGPKGLRVERAYYDSPDGQIEKIREYWAELTDNGLESESVVLLLGPSNDSDFESLAAEHGVSVQSWEETSAKAGFVRYSSIGRFKGLESEAVIVSNIHGVSEEKLQQLLYVAMTRARSRLVLVLPKGLKGRIDELIAKRFEG